MSALFAGGRHEMAYIEAIERGILDRFLVSPLRRGALVAAGFLYGAVVIVIQSLILIGDAFADGAGFAAGMVVAMLALAVCLGGGVAVVPAGLLAALLLLCAALAARAIRVYQRAV